MGKSGKGYGYTVTSVPDVGPQLQPGGDDNDGGSDGGEPDGSDGEEQNLALKGSEAGFFGRMPLRGCLSVLRRTPCCFGRMPLQGMPVSSEKDALLFWQDEGACGSREEMPARR